MHRGGANIEYAFAGQTTAPKLFTEIQTLGFFNKRQFLFLITQAFETVASLCVLGGNAPTSTLNGTADSCHHMDVVQAGNSAMAFYSVRQSITLIITDDKKKRL